MNYRSRQVKLMWERDIKQKSQAWNQERHQYQQDIINLQNSTDAKIIENLEQDLTKKQDLLNDTIALLGPAEIKSLSDIENLLKGKTLKELKESHQQELETKIANRNQEINQISQQLDQTKERLKFHQENLKTKESIIGEYQQELKDKEQSLQSKEQALTKAQTETEKTKWKAQESINLAKQKITDLETDLLHLAKQKLTNQKQAKALVEQIEKDWAQKQQQWQEQSQNQQDHYAQQLAQTKQEHSEEIKSLKTKHTQDQTRAVQQANQQANQNLQSTKEELETQISSLELKLEVGSRELTEKQTKIQELQQWSQGQHNRIVELENNLALEAQAKTTLQREKQEQKTFYENQIQAEKDQINTEKQTISRQAKRRREVLNKIYEEGGLEMDHLDLIKEILAYDQQ